MARMLVVEGPAPRQGKEESSGAIASAVARSERIPGTLRIAHMTGRRLLQDPPDGLPGTAQFLPEDVAGLKTLCPRDIGAKVPALSLNGPVVLLAETILDETSLSIARLAL